MGALSAVAPVPVPRVGGRSVGWRAPEDRAEGWALVAAVQAGDREAFSRLYSRYEPQVRGFIRRRVRDASMVDDLVSETFMRVLRRIDGGTTEVLHDQGVDVVVWVFTTAKSVISHHFVRAHVQREVPTADTTAASAGTGMGAGVSPYGNPEQEVLDAIERAAIHAAIHAAVGRLRPSKRDCVRLFDLEERSLAEVMAATGRSEQGVYSLRMRARYQLATDLDPDGTTGADRYERAAERALTAHELRSRQPAQVTVRLSPEQAALAECATQRDALRVAWRFLGVVGTPQAADVPPAVAWLAGHGRELDMKWAYRIRRKIAAAAKNNAETGRAAA